MTAPVRAVLDRAFRDRPLPRIERTERIEGGNRKRTVRITVADGPDLVLQYVSGDPARLVTEGALSRAVAGRTPLPIPPIVACGTLGGGSYLLREWVTGTALSEVFGSLDPPTRIETARTLGESLGRVHTTLEFDAFGPLASDTEVSAAAVGGGIATTDTVTIASTAGTAATAGGGLAVVTPAADWRTAFRGLVDDGLDAFHGPLADLEPAIRRALDAGIETIPRAPTPRPFPWDYRLGNVLVDGTDSGTGNGTGPELAAILDLESPRSAHREFSLAKAEYLLADWYDASVTNGGFDSDISFGSVGGAPSVGNGNDGVGGEAVREAFYSRYAEHLSIPDAYWDERCRLYRLGAIVRAAFDSRGAVTRPGYPLVDAERATRFHREHLRTLL
jgi:hypothetical protein